MSQYQNIAVCDLRAIRSVEGAREIERIENVALLLLPKDAAPEVAEALCAIPRVNVASVLYLDLAGDVRAGNGLIELNDRSFRADGSTVVVSNGCALVRSLSPETRGSVVANGIVVIHESLRDVCALDFPLVNGCIQYADFEEAKLFPGCLDADAAFLSYLKPKTMLVVGDSLYMADDVTAELLEQKQVQIIAGNKLYCYPQAAPYLKATATAGNGVAVRDPSEEHGAPNEKR